MVKKPNWSKGGKTGDGRHPYAVDYKHVLFTIPVNRGLLASSPKKVDWADAGGSGTTNARRIDTLSPLTKTNSIYDAIEIIGGFC